MCEKDSQGAGEERRGRGGRKGGGRGGGRPRTVECVQDCPRCYATANLLPTQGLLGGHASNKSGVE